jgi:hypothetical protein
MSQLVELLMDTGRAEDREDSIPQDREAWATQPEPPRPVTPEAARHELFEHWNVAK